MYIDPRMTGEEEGGHWTPLRQHKTPSPAPSSFSGTPEPGQPDQPRVKSAHALEPLAEEEEDEDGEEGKEKGTMRKPAPKKLAVLDRSKFGKFIVSYGNRKLNPKCINYFCQYLVTFDVIYVSYTQYIRLFGNKCTDIFEPRSRKIVWRSCPCKKRILSERLYHR